MDGWMDKGVCVEGFGRLGINNRRKRETRKKNIKQL